AFAKGGVDATELQPVALDNSVRCNRIFFRSSQYYKGTIFVVPRIVSGGGPGARRIYDVYPSDNPNEYNLILKFYFPLNDEVMKSSAASVSKQDSDSCNWATVKEAINHDLGANSEQRINTIARIPLTSLEVNIDGIKDVGLIGRSPGVNKEADILNYYGRSLTAHFKITAQELQFFQKRVISPSGLVAHVRLRFQAKQRDGSVRAEINLQKLRTNFAAAAKAKNLGKIAKADLEAMISASTDSETVKIVSEAGSGTSLEAVAKSAVDKLLGELKTAIDAAPEKQAQSCGADDSSVCVGAVLDILSNKVNRTFSFEQITAPESASSQADVQFVTTRLTDPRIQEVAVQAVYEDPTLGFSLNAGQTITIALASNHLEKIEYVEEKSYITSSQVGELQLIKFLPDLINPNMSTRDQSYNGEVILEGKWSPLGIGYGYTPASQRYLWVRTERFPQRSKVSAEKIKYTLEEFKGLPVAVSFSALGDRYSVKMDELAADNPGYWTGRFDEKTARIFLTATRDLGILRFRDRMKKGEDASDDKKVLDEVTEISESVVGIINSIDHAVLKQDDDALTSQRTITFNVTAPETPEAARALEAKREQAPSGG
ncbi:MAG: hypothetical protein ACXVA9_07315, partial [Bdellovibrionales bacterium]